MADSELLKYYEQGLAKKGRLQIKKVPGFVVLEKHKGLLKTYFKLKDESSGSVYYAKSAIKPAVSAETLISRLYPQLGVPSVTYTPATLGFKNVVLSNDVSGKDTLPALKVKSTIKLSGKNWKDVQESFTPQCVKQMALMQALDVSTFNTDRHLNNLFMHVKNDSLVDGIVTFDHELSYLGAIRGQGRNDYINYFNLATDDPNKAEVMHEVIEVLKTSPIVNMVTSASELAQTLGEGIDLIPQTAKEIKEELGYDISQNYVSKLQSSFDKTAEELAK